MTSTSLVTLALLGSLDRALTVKETTAALRYLVDYVRRREIPVTNDFDHIDRPEGVLQALESLKENGVVECFSDGPEAVYAIGAEQHLAAAYYRNTIIHFFVNGAIAELSLLKAAERGENQSLQGDDVVAEFWEESLLIRDLLKFEFFFADKEAFQRELDDELSFHDPDWERQVAGGSHTIRELVSRVKPFSSHRILRPLFRSLQRCRRRSR